MPIPRLAAATFAALALAGATAAAQSPDYVTRDIATDGRVLHTIVRDTSAGDDFVLSRQTGSGAVLARFGGGYTAAVVGAAPDTAYVVGTDAAVRVYDQSGSGYELADTWPVTSPVAGETLVPTGVSPAGAGVLVSFGAPGGFRGVVALDGTGRAIATWAPPDEGLPAGVTLSPEAVTAVSATRFLVSATACRGGGCAGAAPDGYAYEVALATPSGAPASVTTIQRWQGTALAGVTDLAATSRATVLAVTPSTDPQLNGLFLSASGVVAPTRVLETSAPATRVAAAGSGIAAAAWALEGYPGGSGSVIEPFEPEGTGWVPAGGPWTASWGSAGPPQPVTCDGRPATIVGTPGDDVIRGTRRSDVIVTRGGDDVVRGGGGGDYICLGAGDDVASGGPGADLVMGGRGADRLSGGTGPDLIGGGPGRDRAAGDAGRDRCRAEVVSGCEL